MADSVLLFLRRNIPAFTLNSVYTPCLLVLSVLLVFYVSVACFGCLNLLVYNRIIEGGLTIAVKYIKACEIY